MSKKGNDKKDRTPTEFQLIKLRSTLQLTDKKITDCNLVQLYEQRNRLRNEIDTLAGTKNAWKNRKVVAEEVGLNREQILQRRTSRLAVVNALMSDPHMQTLRQERENIRREITELGGNPGGSDTLASGPASETESGLGSATHGAGLAECSGRGRGLQPGSKPSYARVASINSPTATSTGGTAMSTATSMGSAHTSMDTTWNFNPSHSHPTTPYYMSTAEKVNRMFGDARSVDDYYKDFYNPSTPALRQRKKPCCNCPCCQCKIYHD